jgi:hypothetical protein
MLVLQLQELGFIPIWAERKFPCYKNGTMMLGFYPINVPLELKIHNNYK